MEKRIGNIEDVAEIVGDKINGKFVPKRPPKSTFSMHELLSRPIEPERKKESKPLIPKLTEQ